MSDIEDLARRAVVERVIADKVKQSQYDTKAALLDAMDVGDRKTAKVGDTPVGHVVIAKGATRWAVTDAAALLTWVKDNMPTEVVVTESVRTSYVDALLARAKSAGAAVDHLTGEVVPGIGKREGDPYVTVKPNDDAEAAVLTAIAFDEIRLPGYIDRPALEAGA